jgi:hypothetical protein
MFIVPSNLNFEFLDSNYYLKKSERNHYMSSTRQVSLVYWVDMNGMQYLTHNEKKTCPITNVYICLLWRVDWEKNNGWYIRQFFSSCCSELFIERKTYYYSLNKMLIHLQVRNFIETSDIMKVCATNLFAS